MCNLYVYVHAALLLLPSLVSVSMAGGTVPWSTAQSMEACHPGVLGAPARSPVEV